MQLQQFIIDFIDAIDVEAISPLNAETIFRELDSWDSLAALSLMAMIDDKYQTSLTANEMHLTNTLGELYTLIQSKN
jgi:acyl carrier protein